MNSAIYSRLFLFLGIILGGFAHYIEYPFPYNYGAGAQPYNFQSPCRSSCGNIQPVSYCQRLPCQLQRQPYYLPYAYYGNNRQMVNPYTRTRTSGFLGPYGNAPVQIIDDDSARGGQVVNQQDEYANVPVEIIDDFSGDYWKKIPKLPKVTKSSSSNYSVSQGSVTSNSVSQSKPVRAVITRSFQPLQKNPLIKLDFLNGQPANTEQATVEETTLVPTTIPTTTTTEEDEEVSAVKSWF